MSLLARGNKSTIVAIVLISGFAFNLSLTVLTIALPIIADAFNVSDSLSAWVTLGPLLANAVSTPLFGKVSDTKISPSSIWLFGTSLIIISSIICATAASFELLILGRLLTGVGMGANMPCSMTLLINQYPKNRRSEPVGYWSTALTISPTIGVVLGGLVIEKFSFRVLFLMTIPPAVIAFVLGVFVLPKDGAEVENDGMKPKEKEEVIQNCEAIKLELKPRKSSLVMQDTGQHPIALLPPSPSPSPITLPETPPQPPPPLPKRLDLTGSFLLSTLTISLITFINQGPDLGWSSTPVLTSLIISLISVVLLIYVERRVDDPIIPGILFTDKVILLCVIGRMMFYFTYMGAFIIAPFMLSSVFGLSSGQIALILFSRPCTMSLVSALIPKLQQRYPDVVPSAQAFGVIGGSCLVIAMLGLIAFVKYHLHISVSLFSFILQGLGLGCSSPALTTIISYRTPPSMIGVILALSQMMVTVQTCTGMVLLLAIVVSSGGVDEPNAYVLAFSMGAAVSFATTVSGVGLWLLLENEKNVKEVVQEVKDKVDFDVDADVERSRLLEMEGGKEEGIITIPADNAEGAMITTTLVRRVSHDL